MKPSKTLMEMFRYLSGQALDISEHLGLLRGLAMDPEVSHIVEIGFRGGVSAAALASSGKLLTCYDVEPCTKAVKALRAMAPKFSFVQQDSLKAVMPTCQLLHIDSLHTYKHLLAELRRHADCSEKFIALHDTETFAIRGKDGTTPGLASAIDDFVRENKLWSIILHLRNCNGMTILRRQS